MKKILIALLFICTAQISIAQATKVKSPTKKHTTLKGGGDGIDNRMKGPNGEVVYIGDKGGRYYINANGNKVYMKHKKKKTLF